MAAFLAKLRPNLCKNLNICRLPQRREISGSTNKLQLSTVQSEALEHEDDDLYPAIKPPYPPGKWGDIEKKKAWELYELAEELKSVPIAKGRLEKMAGESDISLRRVQSDDNVPFTMDFKQFITKTHVVNGLPNLYNGIDVDSAFVDVKSQIEDAFLEEYGQQFANKNTVADADHTRFCQRLIGKILNNLIVALSPTQEHLMHAQLDEDVRSECFWRKGGFNVNPLSKPLPGSLFFQHQSQVDYQIRADLPLPQFIDQSEEIVLRGYVPDFTDKHPKYFSVNQWKSRPISISGHWIGDPCEFTSLGVFCTPLKHNWFLRKYGEEACMQQVGNKLLTASFGSCVAQAHNQGFNWLLELTYPFTTQSVYCDGESLMFAAYQLNTLEMWKDEDANPLRNICWISEKMPMYEKLEEGRVHGLNEETFKQLIKTLVLQPEDPGINLRPYLPDDSVPRDKHEFFNKIGEPPFEVPKIGRWQYPRNAVYY